MRNYLGGSHTIFNHNNFIDMINKNPQNKEMIYSEFERWSISDKVIKVNL